MTSEHEYDSMDNEVPAPIVEIEAPETLSAGYQFEANYGGEIFQVTVPKGGVTKGQKFQVPFIRNKLAVSTGTADEAPMGKWKGGLCDCCTYGPCHPSYAFFWFWNGQIMSRMQLNIFGQPGTPEEVEKTSYNMLFIVVFTLYVNIYHLKSLSHISDIIQPKEILFLVYDVSVAIFLIVVATRTRKAVREKYSIPGDTCCGVSNDCCLAVWCGPCVTAQLARQTEVCESVPAACCSYTGLRHAACVTTIYVVLYFMCFIANYR